MADESTQPTDAVRPVVRHLVDRRPDCPDDSSRVLCIRAGERKQKPLPQGVNPFHGWTLDIQKVTCPSCKEWIHA